MRAVRDRSAMPMDTRSSKAGASRWLKRALVVVGATTLLSGGAVLLVLQPWKQPPPVKTDRIDALVELAAGDVVVLREDGSARLISGTPLPDGARLRTGAGARALVRLRDGARAFLDENTTVTVGRALVLEQGRLWLDAPALEQGSEAAVHRLGDLSVSLAEGGASLRHDDEETSIYVADGLAIVESSGGRREVAAGESATLKDGAPIVAGVTFWPDWTGGMGDRSALGRSGSVGTGALFAVDREAPAGSPALPLAIQRQTVKVAMADALAETLVDQRFFNPGARPVEGWYWFTIPEGAQLVGFALETNGQLVEGEIVERHDAVAKYEAAVQRDNDPALLEWIDDRTVRARIFPVPALGTRRIVVRYQQLLHETEGKLRYSYPLAAPPGRESPTIEEFALQVELGELRKRYDVATLGEARAENDGRLVTMRRSGYVPRADFQLELTRKPDAEHEAMRLAALDPGGDQGRFVMLRWAPDLQLDAATVPAGEVVVVVDTSAAGDPSEYLARVAVAEALLRSLSAGDRFAVMSADLTAQVLHPSEGLADASDEAIDSALAQLARHATGGATDLGAIFDAALERVHGLEQPAIVYVGDGLATSGDRRGDALVERVRRSMAGSRARLFTVAVGREVDSPTLDRLAQVGGGRSLRVDSGELAVARALELAGALKTPVLTDIALDVGEGLDDVFTNAAGKLSRGQELVLLARTHHEIPKEITVHGRLGGEAFDRTYEVHIDDGAIVQAVPKLWAAAHIDHLRTDSRGLESVRGQILSLGLEYGLMSPFTSFLALDSESAYAAMGVQRRSRRFGGVRLIANADLAVREAASVRGSGVLDNVLGALSAPFGCGMRSDNKAESSVARSDAPAPTQTTPAVGGRAAASDAKAAKPTAAEPGPQVVAEPEMPEEESPMAPPRGVPGGVPGGLPGDDARVDEAGARTIVTTKKKAAKIPGGGGDEGGGGGQDVDGKGKEGDEGEWLRDAGRTTSQVAVAQRSLPCSDGAARDLTQRRMLWERRLALASDMNAALEVYEATAATCELPGWKDQRTMLQLLQARVQSESDVGVLLGHFAAQADARDWLARALLRRLVDPAMVAAVGRATLGLSVDWAVIDRKVRLATSFDDQLALVRGALAKVPGDPEGERRLMRMLAAHGQRDEAIARGRKIREQGLFTPALAQALGELLVDAGEIEEAQRVLSEIVEFDPDSVASRRLLGDVFLRNGWYDGAYRQYQDLVELQPDDAMAAIRLARAAAGAGRVDEALRILRRIAAGEGRPGADDPRRFARLHAAAYLAAMLIEKDTPKDSIAQELRRLQLFDAPTTWTLLTWRDLEAQLTLARTDEVAVDAVVAADTGLFGLQLADKGIPLVVRHAGADHGRMVEYQRVVIAFDGHEFAVTVDPGRIGPATTTPE
ncbi:MAG TPA: VIT domain-containing protein [Nannocystaceae bacterium]|nr:VIT domain-containing protein [Nannocystaceae bacterium]